MQLIDGKALNDLALSGNVKVREMVASVVMHDVLVALSRLHAAGVVHRDVKPANILVERSGYCYLCDFGVSLFLDEVPPGQEMDQVGTPLYMAPEMLKTIPTKYDAKVDVWSYGVMGFELDLGRTPLQAEKDDMPSQGVIFGALQTMPSPIYQSNFSLRYRGLVQACLEVVPESRPSSLALLEGEMAPRAQSAERKFLARLVTGS
jgi:serine/threonine protein kinase